MTIPLGANGVNVNICSVCRAEGTNIDGPDGEFTHCWECAPEWYATVENGLKHTCDGYPFSDANLNCEACK